MVAEGVAKYMEEFQNSSAAKTWAWPYLDGMVKLGGTSKTAPRRL